MPGEIDKLPNLFLSIRKCLNIAKYLGKNVQIQIIGHTNSTGTERRNRPLSQARANKILSYLISQGIKINQFQALTVSSSLTSQPELTSESKEFNRRVSFKVLINNISK